MEHKSNSRRKFLGQASCAAIGSTTLFSTLFNIKAMNAAAIANSSVYSNPNDYKALVVILLGGGMDAYNMLVPRDSTHYGQYLASRSNLALAQNSLLAITPNNAPAGKQYGLHPSCQHMQSMFESGELAFVSNVGTLLQPTSKQQYNDGVSLPLGLFSHSDQSSHWQTGIPSARVAYGWGGKMADMMAAANENTSLSMSISMSGTNLFQTGNSTTEFSMEGAGPTKIQGYNEGDWIFNKLRSSAINGSVNQGYQNAFKKTYMSTVKQGLEGSDILQAVIDNSPTFTTPFTPYNYGTYTDEFTVALETIARTISGREALGFSRQVFFVNLGGWDMHDDLLADQANLLIVVDKALNSFNKAMIQLGVNDKVTTFSLSEFARTLGSNGDGTDHAWGTNTFVMGGAVNGKNMYGSYPSLASGPSNPLEVYGSLIPTTATDQYFRDIALWYGVPPSEIPLLFPNIGNFDSNPLGFI
jgi:uncharacterized protein (DUF1501 family)